jgi:hypothetical protein
MTKKEKSLIIEVIGLLMDGSDKSRKRALCILGELAGIAFPDINQAASNQKLAELLLNVSGKTRW